LTDTYPPQPPVATGLAGRCPRCGQGRLFRGFIDVAPRCDRCGLDFAFAQSADGPAVFVMLIAGFMIVGFALWLDLTFDPPVWVHLVTTLPLGLLVCLGLLRPLKGLFIALQYAHRPRDTEAPS
jgi:uncharacterized protein (DUF983 family)